MPYAVSFDGVKIYYEVVGKGRVPLFLIMGLGMSSRGWIFQVPHFAESYKIFLIDNRGIGKSEVPDSFFSTQDMAYDIYAVMYKEGVERANFVGASMGGMILQKFAAKYPQMVDKLVIACSLAKLDENEKKLIREGLKFTKGLDIDRVDSEVLKSYLNILIDIEPERLLNFLSRNIFTPEFAEKNLEVILEFFRDYIKDGFNVKGFIKQLNAVIEHNSEEDLPKIRAETLVITGDRDKMVPPSKSEFIASKIKNSILKVVSGGSHAFMFEMYEVFNREVDQFLRS